jgi:hypothetical protein
MLFTSGSTLAGYYIESKSRSVSIDILILESKIEGPILAVRHIFLF